MYGFNIFNEKLLWFCVISTNIVSNFLDNVSNFLDNVSNFLDNVSNFLDNVSRFNHYLAIKWLVNSLFLCNTLER